MEPKYGTFHNAETGETVVRELTADEIPEVLEVSDVVAD
jgi:hypothetical protein